MAFKKLLSLLILVGSITALEAVSPGRVSTLTNEQYHSLDYEVQKFYEDSYEDLESRNISYDEQLFRAIRSIRHTVVINHLDFMYSNDEYKLQAMGSSVNKDACKQQLYLLAELAKTATQDQSNGSYIPLSIIDFLESSAHPESGILNGNFVWLGSYNSCIRAKISIKALESYVSSQVRRQAISIAEDRPFEAIKGRYCVAHLRARSWPKFDVYFENRLTLKKAVCLPETCHTAIYEQDKEIQKLVDYISRQNLAPPFNQDNRYETSSLYCLPDEDSEFRQMDLGAKLFIVFVAFWVIFTAFLNMKYYQRHKTIQKLRETVDIRMIIDERLDDDILSNFGDDEQEEALESQQMSDNRSDTRSLDKSMRSDDEEQHHEEQQQGESQQQMSPSRSSKLKLNKNLLQAGARQLKKQFGVRDGEGKTTKSNNDQADNRSSSSLAIISNSLASISAQSSLASTPMPSDMDETDIELLKSFQPMSKKTKKKSDQKKSANFEFEEQSKNYSLGSLDLVRAFSVEQNYKFLVKPRSNLVSTERDVKTKCDPGVQEASDRTESSTTCSYERSRGSQQLASVARRTSNLNDKLIKDLQQQDSGVAIVSKSKISCESKSETRNRRVNIEYLDGLKVIATSYIVLGHTLMFFFGNSNDLRFASERMLDLAMVITINTLQVVGLFYIITGCLLTYLSFSHTKLGQLLNPSFWFLIMIGRYFRLLPAYLIVFWFSRHVASHLGSGRDWYDYRTDVEHPRGFCRTESWWVMLTMSAADIKIPMDCVPQAWYLSDDFRTLLVLPLYVYLLARNVMLGYGAIFATIAYSTLRLVTVLREANIDYKVLLAYQPHVYSLMVDRLHHVYTDFYIRMSSYLLGVIIGHVLYLYEIKRIKELPRLLRLVGMKLSLAVGLVIYSGAKLIANPYLNQFLPSKESLNSDTIVLLIPFFKITMEICLSIMCLLLVTGGGNPVVKRLLSSSSMKILSNISYAVFLTHVEIMYKLPGFRFESTYWYLVMSSIYFIVAAHAIAFLLHLFYEMPINNIIRHVFKWALASIRG